MAAGTLVAANVVMGREAMLTLGRLAKVLASDANYTLLITEYIYPEIDFTSGVSLTATRNVVLPLTAGAFLMVKNSTTGAQALQFLGASGTGVVVPNGAQAMIRCDGTNWFRVGPHMLTGSATVDIASTADGDDVSANVTVTGAAVGDPCFAGLTTLTTDDVMISAKVSAADTVEVTFLNRSGGAWDPASGTLKAVVLKTI